MVRKKDKGFEKSVIVYFFKNCFGSIFFLRYVCRKVFIFFVIIGVVILLFIMKLFIILFLGYCGNLYKFVDKIVFIYVIDLEKRLVVMYFRKYLMFIV